MSGSIQFFGNSDRKQDGGVRSFMPGWYNKHYIEQLKEEIDSIKRRRQLGEIPDDALPEQMALLKKAEDKYNAIVSEKPNLSDSQKDKCDKVRKSIGDKITELYPTKSQMDGHDELDIAWEAENKEVARVHLSPEEVKLAKECNVRIHKGNKITRDAAVKMWKLLSAALGEQTNPEMLRRSGMHEERNYIMKQKDTQADRMLHLDENPQSSKKDKKQYETRL